MTNNVFGVDLITAAIKERTKQVYEKGYKELHDSGYTNEELLKAAACFLVGEELYIDYQKEEYKPIWPWSNASNYTISKMIEKDKITRMKIAVALIMAEADRMQFADELCFDNSK